MPPLCVNYEAVDTRAADAIQRAVQDAKSAFDVIQKVSAIVRARDRFLSAAQTFERKIEDAAYNAL